MPLIFILFAALVMGFICFILFLPLLVIKRYTTYFSEYDGVGVSTKTGHATFSREDFKNKNSPRYEFLHYLRRKGIYNIDQVINFFITEGVNLDEEIAHFERLHNKKISEDFWDNKY